MAFPCKDEEIQDLSHRVIIGYIEIDALRLINMPLSDTICLY